MKPIAVFTTVATRADAQALARSLVERRLAACAQISEIESWYRWEGELRHEPEFRVLFKTTETLYPDVEAAIRALHRYELPAIHSLAMASVHEPYAQWIAQNTRGSGNDGGGAPR